MLTKVIRNHLAIYEGQVIVLYTLDLHSAVCHLYFNKKLKKKRRETKAVSSRSLHSTVDTNNKSVYL